MRSYFSLNNNNNNNNNHPSNLVILRLSNYELYNSTIALYKIDHCVYVIYLTCLLRNKLHVTARGNPGLSS